MSNHRSGGPTPVSQHRAFVAQALPHPGGQVMYHQEVDTAREGWQFLLGRIDALWNTFPEDPNGAIVHAHTSLHNIDQSSAGMFHTDTPNGNDGDPNDAGVTWLVLPYGDPRIDYAIHPID